MPIITSVPRLPTYGDVAVSVPDIASWDFTLGTDPIDHAAWPITAGSGTPQDEDGKTYATNVLMVQAGAKGLYVPFNKTNLLLQSRTFGTTWTLNRVTQARNAQDATATASTATTLSETATTGTHGVSQSISNPVASASYGLSFNVKPGTRDRIKLMIGTAFAVFNLAASSVFSSSGNDSASIWGLNNGFYRVSITATMSATPGTTLAIEARIVSTGSTDSYAGATTSNLIIDQSMLITAAPGQPYNSVVTTTATAASTPGRIVKTWGSAQLTGTRIFRFQPPDGSTSTRFLFVLDSGSNADLVALMLNIPSGQLVGRLAVAGSPTNTNIAVVTPGTRYSAGLTWDQTGAWMYLSGGAIIHHALTPTANLTREYLGAGSGGSSSWESRLFKAKYWSTRLPDAQFIAAVDAL